MVFSTVALLAVVLGAGREVIGAMDVRDQNLMEATSLIRGGISVGAVKMAPLPVEILRSPQFSSLLNAYAEDTALEKALGECRLWIDVERFKANEMTAHPPLPASEVTGGGESKETVSSPQHTPRANAEEGQCASLNKRFGWSIRKSIGPLLAPVSFAVCTEGPWFADIEVMKVEADETDEFEAGPLLLHVKYSPTLPDTFSSKMPSKMPLVPSQILAPSSDDGARPPRPGEKATALCLEKGQPLLLSRHADNETAYLEFLPGPWSVAVDVELYADVSRPMGVGVRLLLRDNVAVTLPPSRLLPFTTDGLGTEQWLLLELADLHAQQQRRSGAAGVQEAHEVHGAELWDKIQRDRAMEAFSTRQCRLKRGERFSDPVQLDCLPDIKGQSRKELAMNGLDVIRRGVIGLVLALIPTFGINAAFHSLIWSNDGLAQRVEKEAKDLSLFSLKREWRLTAPLEMLGKPEGAQKALSIAMRCWTPKQTEVLDTLASELLQLYAQGGKDRTKYKTEGKITFAESDNKLVIHYPVSQLSYARRLALDLMLDTDTVLVFTFTDMGGHFHPFHKVPSTQGETATVKEQQDILAATGGTQVSQNVKEERTGGKACEAGQATGKEPSAQETQTAAAHKISDQEGAESTAKGIDGQQLEAVTDANGAQENKARELDAAAVAKDKPGSTEENREERITYLQLLWQKVGEPQHHELKRTAIANIVWDVGLSAAFLIIAYLTAKLVGSVNGRTVADILRERRSCRLASLRISEIDVIPTVSSEAHVHEASLKDSRTEDAAVAEGVETNGMLKAT
ncbi:hypothetical protein, conserved [Eimeria praecox]|uniref:Uncharacterized protein n=1 Tax=Eimeria praecox TaxID=51316 RepID=U6G5N0_9EIME|nr:hypothetical protein, conserved [Eimeria praecox]